MQNCLSRSGKAAFLNYSKGSEKKFVERKVVGIEYKILEPITERIGVCVWGGGEHRIETRWEGGTVRKPEKHCIGASTCSANI